MVSARRPPLLCRLKVSGPYYSEFKQEAPALTDGAAVTNAHASSPAGDSTQPAAAALTAAAIRSGVEAAVAAVMGAVPASTEPLVEAGLDSLGGCLPPTSVHKCISGTGAGARLDSVRVYGLRYWAVESCTCTSATDGFGNTLDDRALVHHKRS
jgi:hypothetical protein